MAIKAIPTISEPIHLRDISKDVAALEGDCPRDECAWVIVRQGTEADNMRKSAMQSKTTLRWDDDGAVEERDANRRDVWTMEVYLCLCEAGNIFGGDDKPLLRFRDEGSYKKVDHDYEEFCKRYGSLPSIVTAAILKAVYRLNPDWSWMVAEKEGEA